MILGLTNHRRVVYYKRPASLTLATIRFLIALIGCLVLASSLRADPAIFWTDAGTGLVQSAFLDGSNIMDIASNQQAGGLRGIAVHRASELTFWGNELIPSVSRALFDGSERQQILSVAATDLAVDPINNKLYSADRSTGRIRRSNLDGSSLETLVSGSLRGLALDLLHETMYWVDPTIGVMRSDLDGANAEAIVTSNIGFLETIAVSPTNGKIFWVDSGRGELRRANLDGTNASVLVTGAGGGIRGIAYEQTNDQVYWTGTGGLLHRVNSNGSGREVFLSGLDVPRRIATRAVTGPSDPDFNNDGELDCADVDDLVAEIVSGIHNLTFDVTGDGSVDHADLDEWRVQGGAANLPSGNPYLEGDATLDGTVDGLDFIAWNDNKFTSVAAWCSGDFNADGLIDGLDFILWNENKFTSSDGISVVPEPSLGTLLLAALMSVAIVRHR